MRRLVPLALLAGLLACSTERLGGTGATGGAFGIGGTGTTGGTTGAGGLVSTGTGGQGAGTGGVRGGAAGAGGRTHVLDAGPSPATDGGADASFDATPCDASSQFPCCWDGGCRILI
jgi:hypothetical protein